MLKIHSKSPRNKIGMLEIILTWNKKLISDIWHCSAKNWSRSAEFLDKSVNQRLGIRSTGFARLAVLWSFTNNSLSIAWTTNTQSCRTLLASPLDLHKLSLAQICWINTSRVYLNFLALALVTGPIGTWIRSTLQLLVVPLSFMNW